MTERKPPSERAGPPPSLLLVTLDTTRADAIGPEAPDVETKAFSALARRGRLFRQAYATVPETLPSHASILSGSYPGGHHVHENARPVPGELPLVAERLRAAGYSTAAFVSSFVLARRFGLARGFETYDDELPHGKAERTARETTERAIAHVAAAGAKPLFLWVHYYDPHHPYLPPEPYRARYASSLYRGEVAAMDEQLGRLLEAFERRTRGGAAMVVVGDHGEGLGEHGEAQHGRLLYQATMRVPLAVVGPGLTPATVDTPVSARRVFHTLVDFAGLGERELSLRHEATPEPVLGEAMKPYLAYGWQPQVMAVEGRLKAIQAGRLEAYDIAADAGETRDLADTAQLSRELRDALRGYPVPSLAPAPAQATLGAEERRKLATLGYVSAGTAPVLRQDAPRPADMTALFDALDAAAARFVSEDYARAIPLLQQILALDAFNLDAALRLASAHSALGHQALAEEAFARAEAIAPGSQDVRTYRALHYARGSEWPRAVPLLEQVVAETPERLPAVEALAVVRERQGRLADAVALRQKIYSLRAPTPAELAQLGRLAMGAGDTATATSAFEKARTLQGSSFAHYLELGVLYLAAQRLPEAREALDRVPPSHSAYPMALFKRAQVSVLLHEPDQAARIRKARQHADSTTRELIDKERLFREGS